MYLVQYTDRVVHCIFLVVHLSATFVSSPHRREHYKRNVRFVDCVVGQRLKNPLSTIVRAKEHARSRQHGLMSLAGRPELPHHELDVIHTTAVFLLLLFRPLTSPQSLNT